MIKAAPLNGKEPKEPIKAAPLNGKEPKEPISVLFIWWPETESNRRHEDFQSSALPTELSGPTGCY